jgi:hypothetical protein
MSMISLISKPLKLLLFKIEYFILTFKTFISYSQWIKVPVNIFRRQYERLFDPILGYLLEWRVYNQQFLDYQRCLIRTTCVYERCYCRWSCSYWLKVRLRRLWFVCWFAHLFYYREILLWTHRLLARFLLYLDCYTGIK